MESIVESVGRGTVVENVGRSKVWCKESAWVLRNSTVSG